MPSLEARKWDRLCDQYVSDAVQAIVSDTIEERFDERTAAQARGRLDVAYGMREAQLAANEFLAGGTFTRRLRRRARPVLRPGDPPVGRG
ncbi:MAG: hypothetical protein ACR2GZ_08885 [Solirubrobacteraceae bacterium]